MTFSSFRTRIILRKTPKPLSSNMTQKKLEAQTLTQCMDDLYLHVPPKKLPSFVGKYMLYKRQAFFNLSHCTPSKTPRRKNGRFYDFHAQQTHGEHITDHSSLKKI